MPFAALAGAAVGAIGSIVGGGQQADAANNATAAQLQMFEEQKKTLDPFVQAGSGTIADILAGLKPGGQFNQPFSWQDFMKSPGYDFIKGEGINAITNSAAPRGGIFGGNTLRALDEYGTGLASQEYWNARSAFNQDQQRIFGDLFGLTQLGENAAANVGSGAINTGAGIANTILQGGNAASATTGAVSNTLSNFLNNPQIAALLAAQIGGGGTQAPSEFGVTGFG